jgi:hypothetical protein
LDYVRVYWLISGHGGYMLVTVFLFVTCTIFRHKMEHDQNNSRMTCETVKKSIRSNIHTYVSTSTYLKMEVMYLNIF